MQKIWKELQEVPTYRQARHELAEGQCPNGGGPVVKRHKKKKIKLERLTDCVIFLVIVTVDQCCT